MIEMGILLNEYYMKRVRLLRNNKRRKQSHYYPFARPVHSFGGLKHQGYNTQHQVFAFDQHEGNVTLINIPEDTGDGYHYKYNGKEYQDELGLDWYDYGARNYQEIGRASLGKECRSRRS